MKNKKAFTLIELIAVLVILAILALIVTPLVMSIIKKSKDAANKRSVDGYGRALELAVSEYSLDTGKYPTSLDMVEPKYEGNKVICNVRLLKENGDVYLSECTVNGKEVKDSKTDDGWYHYGKKFLTEINYVDMYGKSLEKAVKKYYTDNGSLPLHVETLDNDYNGKDVKCNLFMNYDGTVYLTKCNVNGIEITDNNTEDGYYHYGKKKKDGSYYVDQYGEKLSLAIKNYHDSHNQYPNNISELNLESDEEDLNCHIIINDDGTVFLTRCGKNDIEIKDKNTEDGYYHYGIKYKSFSVGDQVTYNNMVFNVIKTSVDTESKVTLLKKEPLRVDELKNYAESPEYVYTFNKYTWGNYISEYGKVKYSESCFDTSGTNCDMSYDESNVKLIVDAWALDKIGNDNLKTDSIGYKARLLVFDDITTILGYTPNIESNTINFNNSMPEAPKYLYYTDDCGDSLCNYWTMAKYNDSSKIWVIYNSKSVEPQPVSYTAMVRPVVTIKKSLVM